jgi:nucleotide-binding universal stress UspA family protein
MIQHILVGLDGSEYSDTALQHGLFLAKTFQATLHGLHVVDIVQVESPVLHDLSGAVGVAPLFNLTAQMRQNLEFRGRQLLAQFRQTCEAAQVACVEHLATGVVPTEIIRAAADVDLILLGRGGLHTRLSKALLGSAVETVVRRGAKPTMVTPLHYDQMRKPLLATDGSPSAMAALYIAATLVKPLKLPLQVVHCILTAEAGQQVLEDAHARLAAEGVACTTDVCLGNTPEDLVHYMRHHEYDMLFMGAFGRKRMVEWVLGSTTQYVLRTCPGSLMLCHAAQPTESSSGKKENPP